MRPLDRGWWVPEGSTTRPLSGKVEWDEFSTEISLYVRKRPVGDTVLPRAGGQVTARTTMERD